MVEHRSGRKLNDGIAIEGRAPLDLGRWQMLTATYDGRTLRLYKDGAPLGEGVIGLSDDEPVVRLMPPDPWEGKRRFAGDVRELTIWRSALPPESLAALLAGAPADEED